MLKTLLGLPKIFLTRMQQMSKKNRKSQTTPTNLVSVQRPAYQEFLLRQENKPEEVVVEVVEEEKKEEKPESKIRHTTEDLSKDTYYFEYDKAIIIRI